MRFRLLIFGVLVSGTACSSAPPAPPPVLAPGAGVVTAGSASIIAEAERAATAYTPADIEFMTGMVPHHAQAVVMAGWCETHGARRDLVPLCNRIVIAQRSEIRMMRQWLADRGQEVPDSLAMRHVMRMGGTVHEMMMPGMLTDEELAALEQARGTQFDYLFLTGMIRHHQGAIQMVQELWAQPGSATEDTVWRFSNDVVADQTAEIERMQLMLESMPR
jgi:uncharacterized protein (DUF305 family)